MTATVTNNVLFMDLHLPRCELVTSRPTLWPVKSTLMLWMCQMMPLRFFSAVFFSGNIRFNRRLHLQTKRMVREQPPPTRQTNHAERQR